MKRKAIWCVAALLSSVAAFGVTYDPELHGNPIVYDPAEPVVIDGTNAVIDGQGVARCATVGANVTLKNFTFRNGFADFGGGVRGGTLVGCRIERCTADLGGGAYGAVLSNCTVSGCTAAESGAALGDCTAVGCELTGNTRPVSAAKAAVHGGVAFGSELTRCTLKDNVVGLGAAAPAFGGLGADLTLVGCTVTNNAVTAADGVCYGLAFARTARDGAYREFDDELTGVSPSPGPTPSDPQPDPSSYVPETNVVFAVGEGMVGRYYGEVYLDQLGAGLSRAYDRKTTVKAEGLPSGLKLVKTDDGAGYAYLVTGVPTEALDGVTRRAYVRITDAAKNVSLLPLTALKIRPAFVAAFPAATNKVEYWKFPVAKVWPGYVGNEKNWTFGGWPTGLKLATAATSYGGGEVEAGRLYGTPTKVGSFTVTATEKIAGTSYKSTHLATFPVCYEDGKAPAQPEEKPVPAVTLDLGALPETVESVKDIRVGVAYDWAVSNTPYATVSASGLPSGLSLKAAKDAAGRNSYRVTGVPTKAGKYVATFTAKLNGVTSKGTAAFDVADLPAWAQGTFDGGTDETFEEDGQAAFTVSKAGKISGKWLSGGVTWTVTAASYARYEREEPPHYVASLVFEAKSGKTLRTFAKELAVAEDALGGLATNALFLAYQDNWKYEPWKGLGKKLAKAPAYVFVPDGHAANETVSLKVAATGKVTVKGQFVKSVSATGKVAWYSASGSAVLCPQTEPEADGTFEGVVFVYLPPKAGTPLEGGLYQCVRLRWNGVAFEAAE